jgi:hypothetical protein
VDAVAENVWTLQHPLRVLGIDVRRTTTLIRLCEGRLIIHSTAPFTPKDVEQIRALGEPAWLIDATAAHDTCAAKARAIFPDIPYLVPETFSKRVELRAEPLCGLPSAWRGEIEMLKVGGMPRIQEHVFLHVPSRTLIVADLLVNISAAYPAWMQWFAHAVMQWDGGVGMDPLFRWMIEDRAAFRKSIAEILKWDFGRLIVGHAGVVDRDVKERVAEVLERVRAK